MPRKIYIYKRPDTGRFWADFKVPEGQKSVASYNCKNEAAAEKLLINPPKLPEGADYLSDRVAALAERAIADLHRNDRSTQETDTHQIREIKKEQSFLNKILTRFSW